MSKINPGLYSSEDQTWWSAPKTVNKILAFEGRAAFDLDPACSSKNIPAHRHYIYPESCGIALPWVSHAERPLVYINPPYGDDERPCRANCKKKKCQKRGQCTDKPSYGIATFMKKIAHESAKGARVWALLPCRTETKYQHAYGLAVAGFTVIMKGREKFLKDGKPYMILDKKTGKWKEGNAPFPTMLLYYGDDWQEKADRWLANPPLEGTLMITGERVRGKADEMVQTHV